MQTRSNPNKARGMKVHLMLPGAEKRLRVLAVCGKYAEEAAISADLVTCKKCLHFIKVMERLKNYE